MHDSDDLLARMGRLRHFNGLTPDDLAVILAIGRMHTIAEDVTLFREGEPCAGVYVLIDGEIHLYKTGPDGREHIMIVLRPVTMFNEVSMLDGGTNPATAVAATQSTIWHTSATHFNNLLQQYPQIALGLLPILAARNRWLIEQYEDLSFRTVRARSAKLILELSDNGRFPIDRRQHPVHEIAARIATVPEAVSRSLSNFDKQGFITCTRATITVNQAAALTHLAQISPDFPL